jgi:carbon monoxide dehydrogenase subunit G
VQLQQSFEVSAPRERVWSALIDVEQVAPCLPGASITGRNDDGSYTGAFAVKIGPTSAAYTGRLEMVEIDEPTHTAKMQANGTDKRGQGGASATIVSVVTELSPGVTRVEVDTDYRITGRLARFGRGGMIEDISQKLLRQFADNLQALLSEPEPGPEPGTGPEATPQTASEPAPTAPGDGRGPVAGATVEPADLGGAVSEALLARARPVALALVALLTLRAIRARGRRRSRAPASSRRGRSG